ncbi:MAG: Aminomethyltransferase, mitochondrial [Chaenotheca gracillima]|nr:MAG: Aminomethyltransferase, mitochondrial [Chaenotheca gracillima]
MRGWSIEIYLVDENGNDVPATIFEKATYKLHPSFKNPTQVVKTAPFRIAEEGWGEFDMDIVLTAAEKGGDHSIAHDLNFQKERYEAKHTLTFKNPKPGLLAALKESGPVPGEENGIKKKKHEEESAKKRKRAGQNVDMEKLADGLQKLQEDDLLHVVQLVHDNKTPDTYTKNDVEQGEFHVDLYTLPDHLIKMLWDFTASKVEV